jgi:hypothetical protein
LPAVIRQPLSSAPALAAPPASAFFLQFRNAFRWERAQPVIVPGDVRLALGAGGVGAGRQHAGVERRAEGVAQGKRDRRRRRGDGGLGVDLVLIRVERRRVGWWRVGAHQERHGESGQVGDVAAARLVRDRLQSLLRQPALGIRAEADLDRGHRAELIGGAALETVEGHLRLRLGLQRHALVDGGDALARVAIQRLGPSAADGYDDDERRQNELCHEVPPGRVL